jgi:hypothetical protein
MYQSVNTSCGNLLQGFIFKFFLKRSIFFFATRINRDIIFKVFHLHFEQFTRMLDLMLALVFFFSNFNFCIWFFFLLQQENKASIF